MLLPAGHLHDLRDGGALRPAQGVDHLGLLGDPRLRLGLLVRAGFEDFSAAGLRGAFLAALGLRCFLAAVVFVVMIVVS
jgi:hypothetical protein